MECFIRLEHIRLHEKHRGHESMHAEMVLILFATLVLSQVALLKWRQTYPRSYHVSESQQAPHDIGMLRELLQLFNLEIKISDLHVARNVDNTSCDVCQECLDEIRVHLDRHVHHI